MSLSNHPGITTERLLLRPLRSADAKDVQRLAGDEAISRDALNIPHPFEDGMAEAWISGLGEDAAVFAVTLKSNGEFIGVAGLTVHRKDSKAEIAYWVGREFWGGGFASEAARAVLNYGFTVMNLNRIFGNCLSRNAGSARVMRKIGMSKEGTLVQDVFHRGVFEDVDCYAMIRRDFEKLNQE